MQDWIKIMTKKSKLSARWSKREKDILINYPRSVDGHLMHYFLTACYIKGGDGSLGNNMLEELKLRGYDITTLKFSIERFPKKEEV